MIRWGSGNGRRVALAAGTVVVVGLAVLSGAWAFSGASGSPFATGQNPDSVVIADFNGDGKLDLATANQGGGVSVLLGDGASDPHFAEVAGSPFPVAGTPYVVATGDFNGDGKADLAVSGQDAGIVSVLLGDGTGGFAAAPGSPFAVSGWPYALAVADVNGDGKADIATVDYNPSGVSVLLGDGAGGFSKAGNSPFAQDIDLAGLAIGDVNGDGKPDLVATTNFADGMWVFLGDGAADPSFTPASGSPFPAASDVRSFGVTIGDVNGDGKPDLVTANDYTGSISVLLGDGAAQPNFTATAASPIPTGGDGPTAVALGDVDGDGHVDAVAVNQNTNDVSVLLGDGTGAFTPATGSPFTTSGSGSSSLAIADMNGDGLIDLVTANSTSNNVSVLLNPAPATTTTTEPATTTTTTTEPATTTTTEPATTTTTTEPATTTTTTEPATTTTTQPATTPTTRKPTRRGTGLPGDPSGDQNGLPRTGADSTAPLVTLAVILTGLGALLLVPRRRSGAS
jgi:LPXTG-motif cell wall-anchored protein